MRVDNQTSDPVDWEQTGGGLPPMVENCESGKLAPKGQPGSEHTFTPGGSPPYKVCFTYPQNGPVTRMVCSREFLNPDADVLLCSWKAVAVDEKCPE